MRRYPLLLLSLVVSFALPTSAIRCETIRQQAEDFDQCYDVGGYPIQDSGLGSLIGLDYQNDWVNYGITASDFGIFSATLRCRGELGRQYTVNMLLYPEEPSMPQQITFGFTGQGFS